MAGIVTLGGNYVIHLTYKPTGMDEGAEWLIACMPDVTSFRTSSYQPNYLRSNDTRAVTCDQCKKTSIFKEVQKREHQ